jgi:hypothetical protein
LEKARTCLLRGGKNFCFQNALAYFGVLNTFTTLKATFVGKLRSKLYQGYACDNFRPFGDKHPGASLIQLPPG